MPACRCCSRRSRSVGKIDRAAVIKEMQTGTFDTIIGKVKLENNLPTRISGWSASGRAATSSASRPAGNEGARTPVVPEAGLEDSGRERSRDRQPPADLTDMHANAICRRPRCSGGMYALIAMGLTLQYGVARIMNLSYGEFLVAAAFAAYWLFTGWRMNPLIGLLIVVPVGFAHQLAASTTSLLSRWCGARKNARRARGRQHPRDLRPAVRHPGRRCWRCSAAQLLQLFATCRFRSTCSAHNVALNRLLALALRGGHRAGALSRADAHALRHRDARRRGRSGRRAAGRDRRAQRPRLSPSRSAARWSAAGGVLVAMFLTFNASGRGLHHEGADRGHHGRRRQSARRARRRPDRSASSKPLVARLRRSRPDARGRPTRCSSACCWCGRRACSGGPAR